MPSDHRFKLNQFIIVLFGVGLVGCATRAPLKESQNVEFDGVYRESMVDVVNRAPQSMSIPELQTGTVIDNYHLQAQADYHFSLAETYSLEGNSPRAVEEYKATLLYDQKSGLVRLRLATEYIKQGLVSQAIEQTKQAIEVNPNYDDAHMLLGGLYSALHMYDDAVSEYQTVIKNAPENMDAPLFIGAIYAEQRKYSESENYFEALAKNPKNKNAHQAWYYLGRLKLEKKNNGVGDAHAAESAFKQSLALRPAYVESLLALGQVYSSTGRRGEMKTLYRIFQEKYGPHPLVAEELAKVYIEDKEYAAAFDQLRILETNDPADLNVKTKIAFLLIEQHKYDEAIQQLEEILAIEPNSDKITFYLGAVYEEMKNYSAAIASFQKVPTESTYFQEAIVHTAYLYKIGSEFDKAIETVENAIKANDSLPQLYAMLASLLDDTKQYSKALKLLEVAVEKFPQHTQLQFYLGSVQDRLGNRAETIVSMQRVLGMDQNHVQALNYLAYSYADQGKQLDEAEKLVRRALELQPNDGYILDTLGWVLYKKGRVNEAVRVLEAAYKIQPGESIIAEHLGDAYYHLQMPEKAKRLYIRAVERETNVATIEKIRSKLLSIDQQRTNLRTENSTRLPASSPTPAP